MALLFNYFMKNKKKLKHFYFKQKYLNGIRVSAEKNQSTSTFQTPFSVKETS